jgi:hypothetical protein
MRKRIYFDRFRGNEWPELHEIEVFFLSPNEQQWSYLGGNDNWSVELEGVNGTEHLDIADRRRIDIRLNMWGHPEHGVTLIYEKIGGGFGEAFSSKGDMSRIAEWIRTLQGDLMPVGLFIPFEEAWKAVKEFMETDGALPRSIEWVENKSLPEGTFPPPWALDIPSRNA